MIFRMFFIWLMLGLIAAVASGCDNSCVSCDCIDQDVSDAGTTPDTEAESDAETADLSDGATDNPLSGDIGAILEDVGVCGNGIVEGVEVCDDANLDSRDGCTTLCELTCVENEDCDDMNDCNGQEVCVDNACDDSAEDLDDGEMCDDDETKSCWLGVCVSNICGDGKVTAGEDCDDGNRDPDDGCTPDCSFTCEEDSDCTSGDVCLGDRVCNTEEHICEGGEPLDDKTKCEIQDPATLNLCGEAGWCMNGICVCENCGNKITENDEDCDDGKDNGTENSECSINCRVVKCGDGKVQGDEECDDGNLKRLDGCDVECKYEFAHRLTSMEILKGDPPSWCYYDKNRFAEAFADEVRIMGVIPLDVLPLINDMLTNGIYTGEDNLLFHILDSQDTTMKTADDEISIAVYQGTPGPNDWTDQKPVDFPMYIKRDQVNSDGTPKTYHKVPAIQLGAGKVISSEPETIEMLGLTGIYRVFNYKTQIVFNYDSLSKPAVPSFDEGEFDPDVAYDEKPMALNSNLKLPEESGVGPQGLYCGAIEAGAVDDPVTMIDFSGGGMPSADAMNDPLSMMANFCCKNNGLGPSNQPMYRGCAPDDVVGVDCDSQANILQYGCTVCINTANFNIDDPSQMQSMGSDCSLLDSDPESCFTVIQGIDFDVDADGDGENESWSSLFGFDARRTRLYGVSR